MQCLIFSSPKCVYRRSIGARFSSVGCVLHVDSGDPADHDLMRSKELKAYSRLMIMLERVF
jgi:hypothetical protein